MVTTRAESRLDNHVVSSTNAPIFLEPCEASVSNQDACMADTQSEHKQHASHYSFSSLLRDLMQVSMQNGLNQDLRRN